MKAAVLFENRKISYTDVIEPTTGVGEVKIRVVACGICGSDLPRVFDKAARSYPMILGHELSGVVIEIGTNVKGFEVGDHVVVAPLIPCGKCKSCQEGNYALCNQYSFIGSRQQGGFADYVVVPVNNVIKISEQLSLLQAATVEPATVALHALRHINFERRKNVAVLGCGIIGLYMVQWARILGAGHIVAIGRSSEGLNAAMRMGADQAVSSFDAAAMQSIVSEGSYDYVLECSGADATLKWMLKLVKNKGIACMVGTPKKTLDFTIQEWEQINRKECWVTGSWMSYSAPFPGKEWEATITAMAEGKLIDVDGLVGRVYPMSDAMAAFDCIRNGAVKGRVLLCNEEI